MPTVPFRIVVNETAHRTLGNGDNKMEAHGQYAPLRVTLAHLMAHEAGSSPALIGLEVACFLHPSMVMGGYRRHLDGLVRSVARDYEKRLQQQHRTKQETAFEVAMAAAALSAVLFHQYGYRCDGVHDNATPACDMAMVIDQRLGIAEAIGGLMIHVARAQGWQADAVEVGQIVLIRLQVAGEALLVAPFDEGAVKSPQDLRRLYKANNGMDAELAPGAIGLLDDAGLLVRLYNIIKVHHIKNSTYDEALKTIEIMRVIAPSVAWIWRECGLLLCKTGCLPEAITTLERALAMDTESRDLTGISVLLQQLRRGYAPPAFR